MTPCKHCGTTGVVLFGHHGLCADCYDTHRAHQEKLREESQRNRELLASRIVHPAGRSPRYRAKDMWIQRKDPETGRSTS